MSGLSNGEMLALAGGAVADLEAAETAELVTPDDVVQAEKTAAEAEELAAEAESKAVVGKLKATEATASREHARFARLTAKYTAQRAERWQQAQRIKALNQVGEDAIRHANRLTALRDATLADLATVSELLDGARQRVADWNAELETIAARGAELGPEPPLPTGIPPETSAGVWAGTVDRGPRVIVKRRVISYVDLADPRDDGLPAMIDAAVTETGGATSSTRLCLLPSGVIQTIGADKGGHLQAQINAGTVHELTPRERQRYLRGDAVNWETIRS